MKNYKIWLIVVILLVVANSVLLALMWLHNRPLQSMLHAGMEPKDVLIKELALTPQQMAEYAAMRGKHQQLTVKLNEANHVLRDSLFACIKQPVTDTATINHLTKKIGINQSAMEKATLYHFRELRAILTADQQSKFDNVINGVLRMMARPAPMQQPAQGNMPQGNTHAEKGMHRPPPPNGMPPVGEHNGPPPPPYDAPPPTPL